MKRLKVFFATVILLFLVPAFRLMDYLVILWPSQGLHSLALFFFLGCFVILPLLILSRFKLPALLGFWLGLSLSTLLMPPLSNKATMHAELSHCGLGTYTGLFYPLNAVFWGAYADDLAARNQLCWVRKMILRTPQKFDSPEDQKHYFDLLRKKLLSPPEKFKTTLPLIAWLHGDLATKFETGWMGPVETGQMFIGSLNFWKEHYTTQLTTRTYSWYDWPMSSIVQFEYALVEDNWEGIIEGISIEEGP